MSEKSDYSLRSHASEVPISQDTSVAKSRICSTESSSSTSAKTKSDAIRSVFNNPDKNSAHPYKMHSSVSLSLGTAPAETINLTAYKHGLAL